MVSFKFETTYTRFVHQFGLVYRLFIVCLLKVLCFVQPMVPYLKWTPSPDEYQQSVSRPNARDAGGGAYFL